MLWKNVGSSNVGVYLIIAVRNLVQSGRRTAFLGTALLLVTFLLVLLLSLTQGVTDSLIRSATTIAAGHVNVAGFYKAAAGDASPIITGVPEIKKIVQENVPELVKLVDRHRGWGKIISDTGAIQSGLTGVAIDEEQDLVSILQLAKESEFKPGGGETVSGDVRNLAKPHSIVLFAGQAKRLGVGVGDALTIRTETLKGQSNTCEVTVVAVVRDLGLLSAFSVFMGKETVLELYALRADTSGAVQIQLRDIDDSDKVLTRLRGVFEAKGYKLMEHEANPFFFKFEQVQGEDWTGQKLDLTTWSDEVSFLMWVLTALSSISVFLISILAVIISIGIMNTMWIAVRERTREVGTLRAIGMGRPYVLWMFLLEALILGFVATTIGALLGAVTAIAIDHMGIHIGIDAIVTILMSNTIHLVVTPGHVIAAVLAFTLVSGLSALWPAARAASITPVSAMQTSE